MDEFVKVPKADVSDYITECGFDEGGMDDLVETLMCWITL